MAYATTPVKKPKASMSPQPAKKRKPKPYDPTAALTAAQIRAEADRRIEAIMGPTRKEISADTQHEIESLQGAGTAAAGLLSQGVQPVQDAYSRAARELQGLGTGFTGAVAADAARTGAEATDFAARQGAPAPAPAVDRAALGNSIYEEGVYIPGSSLESQGAAAGALAAAQPGLQASKTYEDIRAATQKGEQALVELGQKRPELRAQVLDELYKIEMSKLSARQAQQDLGIKQQAQDLYAGQFGEKVRHDIAGEKVARTNARTSQRRARQAEKNYQLQLEKHQQAVSQAEREGRAIDPSASKVAGYLVDAENHPILDSHGNRIPVAKTSGNKVGKDGLTKGQATTNKRMAGEAARKMFKERIPKYDKFGDPIAGTSKTYQLYEVINYLMDAYGLPRAQARKLAIDAGFKPNKKAQDKYKRSHRR